VGLLFGIEFLPGLELSFCIALGLSIGMLIGVIIGQAMDAKANKSQKKIMLPAISKHQLIEF
jgi:hypothetical protein